MRPTFAKVYSCLQKHGPAHVVSTRGTAYLVSAEVIRGRETIIARLVERTGDVRTHEDCWGDAETCSGTRAGGIYNGDPSIYDWYHTTCSTT